MGLRRFSPGSRRIDFCNLRGIEDNILAELDPEINNLSSIFESVQNIVIHNKTNIPLPSIDTVEVDKSTCTQQQIMEAETSRKFQNTIGVTTKGLF